MVGKPSAEAQQILAGKHLQLRVADRIYSNLPVNTVVRQSPEPGESIKIPQDANVVLSPLRSAVCVKIPSASKGRSDAGGAYRRCLQSGLATRRSLRTYIFLPPTPSSVLQQTPPPVSAAASPRVDVLVADARPRFTM